MSNSDVRFSYGCPIDTSGLVQEAQKALLDEAGIELNRESTCHCDYWWWGESFGYESNGFSSIPECPDATKADVLGRWNELPENIRELLGEPQEFLIAMTT